MGVVRAPFPVPSDLFTKDSACQRLPPRPAPCPARGAEGGGGVAGRQTREAERGGDAAECAARAPKGGGCAGGGKYGVAFGNKDLPQSRGRGAKLPVCSSDQRHWVGTGGRDASALRQVKRDGRGSAAWRVRGASRRGRQRQRSGVRSKGEPALPASELHSFFFSSG